MKKKILAIMALSILFSSCSMTNDTYISKRHPEDVESVEKQEESTEIKYTEGSNESTEENTQQVENEDIEQKVDDVEFETTGSINMRLGPSTTSGVVTEVPGGETVIKIGQNGEWTRATYQGYTGYILTELLKAKE